MTPAQRRSAPAPLIQHLAAAASIFEDGARLAPLADTDRFPWSGPLSREEAEIAAAVAAAPTTQMALALRQEGAARLSAMLQGLRAYQEHPARRSLADPPAIWSLGSSRLLDFGPAAGRPVFVAPSLINRHHVLDLDDGWSLLARLSEAGLRPLLLDWGDPGMEERRFGLADYVEKRLAPAFDVASAIAGGGALPVVGYCMGGTLSVALGAMRAEKISRLALLGAPWNFDGMRPMRGALAALGFAGERTVLEQAIGAVGATFGAAPVAALQVVFAALDPGLAARKFRRFAEMDPRSDEARRFVLIEDWLNEGPVLSAAAARDALVDWHLDNAPMRGSWMVGGRAVDPSAINAPVFIAAASEDRITPPLATEALAPSFKNARVIRPTAGHVGMIVGRNASSQLWRPLTDFLLG